LQHVLQCVLQCVSLDISSPKGVLQCVILSFHVCCSMFRRGDEQDISSCNQYVPVSFYVPVCTYYYLYGLLSACWSLWSVSRSLWSNTHCNTCCSCNGVSQYVPVCFYVPVCCSGVLCVAADCSGLQFVVVH